MIKPYCLAQPEENREKAKVDFFGAHIDPASKAEKNSCAHLAYISDLVKQYGAGFAVGEKPSIAGRHQTDLAI